MRLCSVAHHSPVSSPDSAPISHLEHFRSLRRNSHSDLLSNRGAIILGSAKPFDHVVLLFGNVVGLDSFSNFVEPVLKRKNLNFYVQVVGN